MTSVYFGGVYTCFVISFCALVMASVTYGLDRSSHYRTKRKVRKSARAVLLSVFAAPLASVLWPLSLVLLVVFGFSYIVRDALMKESHDLDYRY